jgi:tetratricopeptide (TPR) repeat protein
VLAGAAIVAALAVGLAIASIGFVGARTEAARSQQVAQFLKDMLAAAGPSVARGRDATLLREILDKTATRVGSDLKDRPDVQGDLWFALGNTYQDINDYPSAITMFRGAVESYRRAFGDENSKVAIALAHLGRCQSFNKDVATGKANAQLGLAMARKCHDPETLASCLLDMARSFDFWDMGTSQGAPYAREAVELRTQFGNDPAALADCLFVQASTADDEEAIPIYRQLLALHRQQLGPDHPRIANDVFHLGERLWHSGKFKEAEPVLREAVELYRKVYTEDQPQKSLVLRELVETMIRLDEWKDAESLVAQAIAKYPSIPDYGILLGDIQAYEGHWSEAAETFTRTQTGDARAVALLKAGRSEEYRRLRHDYLARDEDVPGTEARFNSAKAALLLPLEQFDLQHAYDLADIDPTTVPEERYQDSLKLVKALAEYRRENFKSAVDLANRVLVRKDEVPKSHQAQALFIQSLAYTQLGRREQASTAFAEGDKLVNLPNRDLLEGFLFNWSQWSIAELLCRESGETLGIAIPTPSTDPQSSEDEVPQDKQSDTRPNTGN